MTVKLTSLKLAILLKTNRYSCCQILIAQSLLILNILKHAEGALFVDTVYNTALSSQYLMYNP